MRATIDERRVKGRGLDGNPSPTVLQRTFRASAEMRIDYFRILNCSNRQVCHLLPVSRLAKNPL